MLKDSRTPKKKTDVRTLLYKDIEGDFSSTMAEASTEEKVLGRKSSSVLEQELTLARKDIDKCSRLADKYYKEKHFLMRRLKMNKSQLLRELWSFQILIQTMKIVRLPGFIGTVLTLNLMLLVYIIFQSGIAQPQKKPQELVSLSHSLEKPYTIQVDAFESLEQAKGMVVDLKGLGYQAYIGKMFQNKKDVYRVYVDEFAHLKDVRKVMKKLKKISAYEKSFVRRKY